ncbi:amino acid kinase family protein [Stetteria hydrogenophila]
MAGLERVVVKVSGSLAESEGYVARLAGVVRDLRRRGVSLAVVVGGGSTARRRISELRAAGVPEAVLDVVGIWAARLNALTLAAALWPLSPLRVPASLEEALDHVAAGLVPILGGLQPGQSTNAVAVALAEALRAPLVNLLRGVPGVIVEGRVAARLSYDELERVVSGKPQTAGGYELFDHVALSMARRSGVRLYFIDGSDPERLKRLVLGEAREGTLVS